MMRRLICILSTILLMSTIGSPRLIECSVAAVGDFSAVIDSLVLLTGNNTKSMVARIGTTHNFVVSSTLSMHGIVETIFCDSLGNIGADTLATYLWSPSTVAIHAGNMSVIVEDNQIIIPYVDGVADTGKVYTIPVGDNGVITRSLQKYIFGMPGVASCPTINRIGTTNFYLLSYGKTDGLWIKSLSIASGAITVIDSLISANSYNFQGTFPGVGRVGQTNFFLIRSARYGAAGKQTYSFTCDPSNGALGAAFVDSLIFTGQNQIGGRAYITRVNANSGNLYICSATDNNNYHDISTFTVDSTNGDISAEIDGVAPSSNVIMGLNDPSMNRIGNGLFLFSGYYRGFGITSIDTSSGAFASEFWSYWKRYEPSATIYPSAIRCGSNQSTSTYYILSTYCAGASYGAVTAFTFSVVGKYEGIEVVPPENSPPVASNVSIIYSDSTVGSLLAGYYDYYDADDDLEGSSLYTWLDSENDTLLEGYGSAYFNYTIAEADIGKSITFKVSEVVAQTGESPGSQDGDSPWVGPIPEEEVIPEAPLDSVWRYKIPVYLESTTQNQMNINKMIVIHWLPGMSEDFADIRFYDKTGDTLFYAWMDSAACVNRDSSSWWVKIPFKPAEGDTIYIYFNNPSAENYSNGDSTFVLFSYDYDAAPLICTQWSSRQSFGYGDRSVGYGISMSWRNSFSQNTPDGLMFDFAFLGSNIGTFVGVSDESGWQWETKFSAPSYPADDIYDGIAYPIPQVRVIPNPELDEPCDVFGYVESYMDTVSRPWHTYRVEIWDSVTTKAYTDNVLESDIYCTTGSYIASEESLRVWIYAWASFKPTNWWWPNGGCDSLCPPITFNFRDVFVYRLKNDVGTPIIGEPIPLEENEEAEVDSLEWVGSGSAYIDTSQYLIRLSDSTYTALLRGQADTRTEGIRISSSFNGNRRAHEFPYTVTGSYGLWFDPLGGWNYSRDRDWSKALGKFIPGPDITNMMAQLDSMQRANNLYFGNLADSSGQGIIASGTAGETLVKGDWLYVNSDGKFWKANASDTTKMPVVAISLSNAFRDMRMDILLSGVFRRDSDKYYFKGMNIYMGTIDGTPTQIPPYEESKSCGVVLTDHIIWFEPSF